MFDLYLTEPFVPFTISLALLFGLLALEVVMSLLGATLLGVGGDADLDVDVELPDIGDLDIDFGDASPSDFDFADAELDADFDNDASVETLSGPTAWLGIGKMPMLIWMAAVLLGFGVVGIALQQLSVAMIGSPLPLAVPFGIAGIAALWFARHFGALFARIIPKTESSALSNRHLGRRTGTVTQGTAKRGSPAEVRIFDRHGNMHHLRGEPLKDTDTISAGTRVLVLRHQHQQGYRLVPLGPDD